MVAGPPCRFLPIAGDWLPFVAERKIAALSFGMGNRRRRQKEETASGEAAGACPALVSWTSFCSGLAPVDRLAPRNVRCTVQLVIVPAGTRSAALEKERRHRALRSLASTFQRANEGKWTNYEGKSTSHGSVGNCQAMEKSHPFISALLPAFFPLSALPISVRIARNFGRS